MIIHREDNFLPEKYCTDLIDIFKTYDYTPYHDTFIFKYTDPEVLKKICKTFPNYNLQFPDNMEIVQWPTNSQMSPHYDPGDRFAFIIYLNDNFTGGETVIDGVSISPKTGRLVLFNNGIYKHEVRQITEGTRYTLISWYK